jgi:hypothetical protein
MNAELCAKKEQLEASGGKNVPPKPEERFMAKNAAQPFVGLA